MRSVICVVLLAALAHFPAAVAQAAQDSGKKFIEHHRSQSSPTNKHDLVTVDSQDVEEFAHLLSPRAAALLRSAAEAGEPLERDVLLHYLAVPMPVPSTSNTAPRSSSTNNDDSPDGSPSDQPMSHPKRSGKKADAVESTLTAERPTGSSLRRERAAPQRFDLHQHFRRVESFYQSRGRKLHGGSRKSTLEDALHVQSPAVKSTKSSGPDPGVFLTNGFSDTLAPITKLWVEFDGSYYVCSGALVNSLAVTTAAHCIYDHESDVWADDIEVIPGMTDVEFPTSSGPSFYDRPFGTVEWQSMFMLGGYADGGNLEDDFALIVTTREIGDWTGWYGWSSASLPSTLSTLGFPAAGPYDGSLALYRTGDSIISSSTTDFYIDNVAYGGDSGGAAYDSNSAVRGVCSRGPIDVWGPNWYTRISSTVSGLISDKISEASPVTAQPDLVDYLDGSPKSISPSSISTGGSFSASIDLINFGEASSGAYTVSLWASSNAILSESDTYLGYASYSSLDSGSYRTHSLSVDSAPMDDGTYYIFAAWWTDSTDEYNSYYNTAVVGMLIVGSTNDDDWTQPSFPITYSCGTSETHTIRPGLGQIMECTLPGPNPTQFVSVYNPYNNPVSVFVTSGSDCDTAADTGSFSHSTGDHVDASTDSTITVFAGDAMSDAKACSIVRCDATDTTCSVQISYEVRSNAIHTCGSSSTTYTAGTTIAIPDDYGAGYGTDQSCFWHIEAPDSSKVAWVQVIMSTEAGYDYIDVYDGSSTSDTQIAHQSGGLMISDPIIASGRDILVHFTSDNSVDSGGFFIISGQTSPSSGDDDYAADDYYAADDGYSSTDDDGSSSTDDDDGSIYDIPVEPTDYLACWLEDSYDVTSDYIFSCPSPGSNPVQGLNISNPAGHSLEVFMTDGSDCAAAAAGNSFMYYGADHIETTTDPSITIFGGHAASNVEACAIVRCQNSVYDCTGLTVRYYVGRNVIRTCEDGSAALSSPTSFAFPSDVSEGYGNDRDCVYHFQAPVGEVAAAMFAMHTEYGYDFLRFYDGDSTSDPLLTSLSGSESGAITATGRDLVVRFTSDSTYDGGGLSVQSFSYSASGGSNDDGSGSNDDGSGSNDDGSGSNDDGSGSNDDGSGSNDDGSGSNNAQTGCMTESSYVVDDRFVFRCDQPGEDGVQFVKVDNPNAQHVAIRTAVGSQCDRAAQGLSFSGESRDYIGDSTDASITLWGGHTTTGQAACAVVECVNPSTSSCGSLGVRYEVQQNVVRNCDDGESIFAPGVTVAMPSDTASGYGNDQKCIFHLHSEDQNMAPWVTVHYSLETGYDQLAIYDKNSPSLATLTGTGTEIFVQAHGQDLWVQLTTDKSIDSGGFFLTSGEGTNTATAGDDDESGGFGDTEEDEDADDESGDTDDGASTDDDTNGGGGGGGNGGASKDSEAAPRKEGIGAGGGAAVGVVVSIVVVGGVAAALWRSGKLSFTGGSSAAAPITGASGNNPPARSARASWMRNPIRGNYGGKGVGEPVV